MNPFDYIIVGGGASGLLLADAMGADPWFQDKRIALIEREPVKENDRTWCFWETGKGAFEGVVHHSWNQIQFKDSEWNARIDLAPFQYNMIRGEDFYQEWNRRILGYANITRIQTTVTAITSQSQGALVYTKNQNYFAKQVFNSVILGDLSALMRPYPVLKQHFIGWRIRTQTPVFDPQTATFMDFSIPQRGNTRFMYVLPFSTHEALVEYTLFSADLLEDEVYEKAIQDYLSGMGITQGYEILEREKGVIPMTCNSFSSADTKNITHIGIAGGWAKPSTGYTFWSSTQKVAQLINAIKAKQSLKMARKNRFWFYDLVMLEVLNRRNELGHTIFSAMFRKLPVTLLLRFLHEQTSLLEDLRVIWACPKTIFIKGLWRTLLKRLFGATTPQIASKPV